jgi:hypothetical protein
VIGRVDQPPSSLAALDLLGRMVGRVRLYHQREVRDFSSLDGLEQLWQELSRQ